MAETNETNVDLPTSSALDVCNRNKLHLNDFVLVVFIISERLMGSIQFLDDSGCISKIGNQILENGAIVEQ